MRVYSMVRPKKLEEMPTAIERAEKLGYDGTTLLELTVPPTLSAVAGAMTTKNINLLTGVFVAFPRSPMATAYDAWAIQSLSKGRFQLGIGTQIKAHLTRRFGMEHLPPVKRMRDYINALHAIWDCWHNGAPLAFQGEFYTHSLMTPMFTPVDTEYGPPKVFLAAVGPKMSEVAGEVADGILIHAFTTERYLREVTLPAVESGLAKSGRSRGEFEISYPGFIVTGQTEEAFNANKAATCKQIAFYGSTPAYAPVLGVHGWGGLQPELNKLSKQGEWDEMGSLITDEILNEFAIVGQLDDVVDKFKARWGALVDRTTGSLPARDDDHARELLRAMSA